MPVYTYQCEACETEATKEHGMDDNPLLACEECGGVLSKKLTVLNTISSQSKAIQDDEKSADNPSSEDAHQCHSGCVLHRHSINPPPS